MLNDSSFYLFTEFHKSEKETYQLCHYGECNFLSVVIYLPSSFMHLKSLTLKNLRNDAPRWCMHFMDERWAKWDKKNNNNTCTVTMAKKTNHIYSHKYCHNFENVLLPANWKQKPADWWLPQYHNENRCSKPRRQSNQQKKPEAWQLENIFHTNEEMEMNRNEDTKISQNFNA